MSDENSLPQPGFQAKLWRVGIPLLLGLVAFWVYWPSLQSGLVYDARLEILEEGFITSISNLPAVLTLKVLGMKLQLGDRPGQLLYLMLIAAICGKAPFGYHLCSNLLHAINVALLFVLLRRLIETEYPELSRRSYWKVQLAVVTVTLIFALHPLAVEVVSVVGYSSDLLVTFFTLLALLAATAYRPQNYRAAILLGAGGVLCAFVAVTCKESGMAAAVLLVVYWFLFRREEAKGPWRWFLGTAAAISTAFLVARFVFAPSHSGVVPYLGGSFGQVFLLQPGLWVFMMGKMLWPLQLSADYVPDDGSMPSTFLALAIWVVVIFLQGWLALNSRMGALGVAIYWLGLATVSNLVPLYRPLADRFYYLPMAGTAMQLLALFLITLKSRWGFWMTVAPCLVALLPLTFLTVDRQRVFESDYSLWSNTLKVSPSSAIAYNGLGLELTRRGQFNEAEELYRKALEIAPNFVSTRDNLGNVLVQRGQLDAAIEEYQKALAIDPDFASAQNNLGNALFDKGQVDEAIAHFQRALEINPNYPDAHYDLGNAFSQKGDITDAIEQYQDTLEMDTDYAKAHDNLGNALVQTGQLDEAIVHYEKALEISPNNARTHFNLGTVYLEKGQLDEAIAQYQVALDIEPNYARAHNNLGLALAREGQVDVAMAQFKAAVEMEPNFIAARANLGMACLKAGQTDEAIAQFQEILRLNPQDSAAQSYLARAQAAARQTQGRK